VLVVGVPEEVAAMPQWNVGVTAAGCSRGYGDALASGIAFCGGVGGDVLFGRERAGDFGAGPYLAVGTAAFDDVRVSGGARWLVPAIEDFPVVISTGALVTDAGALGFDASAFFGLRSYNFHGSYNVAAGVIGGAQRTFGEGSTTVLSLGVQVDALVLAAPFMLAWSAFR
jgi:hypothetical protein